MKSVKRASILLSGILAALATVTTYADSDRDKVPVIDPTAILPVEDPAIAEALGSGIIEYCPPGYELYGPPNAKRLCLTAHWPDLNWGLFGPADYFTAKNYCMNLYGGKLASCNDYNYAYVNTPPDVGSFKVVGIWTGPIYSGTSAFYANSTNVWNCGAGSLFSTQRKFRCALGTNWY